MKSLCLIAVIALSFGAALVPSAAARAEGATEISVSGTGSVSLAPDVANVSANVSTSNDNAQRAVAQNNATYDRIVGALLKLGIARDDVTLSNYNVNYNPRPHVLPLDAAEQRYGYTVSRDFAVKVRNIGKAGEVADACTASGATAVNGVSFGLADQAPARAQAIGLAVTNARANAAALASAAGLHISTIKTIALDDTGEVRPMPMMRMSALAAAPPTQFDQSNVTVSVSVNVTFLATP